MSRRRASAIIIDGDKILMVRILDKGRPWWCLPGGTVERDETPEQALSRELQEELNLPVQSRQRLYEARLPDEEGIDYGILVEPLADAPRLGIDPAVVEWAWRLLDEIDDSWQVEEVRKALADRRR